MKNYLNDFFRKYDYSAEDSCVLIDAYEKISESASAIGMWNEGLRLYAENIDCDYDKIISITDEVAQVTGDNEYTLHLLMLICLSKRAEEICGEYGIDKQMFYENMLDLKYKNEECKLVKGMVGTFVMKWLSGYFNFSRVTFGRLQFEIIKFGDSYEKNGVVLTPESDVINVHIPRTGEPLYEEYCDKAFEEAKAYFKDRLGDVCAFVCSSWLLYAENEKILSKCSNTYKFMKRFDIIETRVDKNRSDLWRLFDTEEKNPRRLPCDTSMRRAYVNHLKSGGKVGASKGVFFM